MNNMRFGELWVRFSSLGIAQSMFVGWVERRMDELYSEVLQLVKVN